MGKLTPVLIYMSIINHKQSLQRASSFCRLSLPTSELSWQLTTLYELNGTQPLSGSMETLVVTRQFLAKPPGEFHILHVWMNARLLTSC